VQGKRNIALLAAILGAVLLPSGWREVSMVAIGAVSYFGTPREVHDKNGFAFGPIVEVGIIFAGLFTCLAPLEVNLAYVAPSLPVRQAWRFSGVRGPVECLDNAPHTASRRWRGLATAAIRAGISSVKLAAVSVRSVVMGATTYVDNGPNLMVDPSPNGPVSMPSFLVTRRCRHGRSMPIHLVTTPPFSWNADGWASYVLELSVERPGRIGALRMRFTATEPSKKRSRPT
jgi:hypothetical protein